MLYIIDNKYYLNVAPNVYKEVIFEVDGNDAKLVMTKNKIECYNEDKVSSIDTNTAKSSFIKSSRETKYNEDNMDSSRRTTRTTINRSKKY